MIMGRVSIAIPMMSAVLLTAVACQTTEVKEVSGLVVDVQSQSILLIESLTIRDQDGKEWTFDIFPQGFIGFTPSHLLEHQAAGELITITYEETPEGLSVVKIED